MGWRVGELAGRGAHAAAPDRWHVPSTPTSPGVQLRREAAPDRSEAIPARYRQSKLRDWRDRVWAPGILDCIRDCDATVGRPEYCDRLETHAGRPHTTT